MTYRTLLSITSFVALAGCHRAPPHPPHPPLEPRAAAIHAGSFDPSQTESNELELGGTHLSHPTPYIPPQCYTATHDESAGVHNPCYTCHQESRAPNYVDDPDLQSDLSFPEPARSNPWTNLFVDRTREANAPSEAEVLAYVRTDNYGVGHSGESLARRLRTVPSGWDIDDDGTWDGYVPDANFRFDSRGFDRASGGAPSGWRTFAYYPFLGTFFPTNGSTDDVLIRLPAAFRERDGGTYDEAIYVLNLAVVEALVRREDVRIEPTDETDFAVDLDRDGHLGVADRVVYEWDPPRGVDMAFVGRARSERAIAGLFPVGTEFLHSVRYIDVTADGIAMAPRMKELRYARKTRLYGPGELEQLAINESREDRDEPDRPREIMGNPEIGVSNGIGWIYQGFIEDRLGALRPQTFEEHVACVGCHGGIGATTDGVFAFPRRLGFEAFQRGWSHPTQRSLAGTADPTRADGRSEYATYLRVNGAGDEFRANDEVRARFFDARGSERADAFAALASDITTLLYPSRERAVRLDRAYLAIVRAQTFNRGRDATTTPVVSVLRSVLEGATTGVATPTSGPGSLGSSARSARP